MKCAQQLCQYYKENEYYNDNYICLVDRKMNHKDKIRECPLPDIIDTYSNVLKTIEMNIKKDVETKKENNDILKDKYYVYCPLCKIDHQVSIEDLKNVIPTSNIERAINEIELPMGYYYCNIQEMHFTANLIRKK